MKFNQFGNTGMKVSEIGFGGSRIGGVFAGRSSSKESVHVLRSALDSGITFYDTADIYAHGESESLIGAAFRGLREQVIIATKGGYCLPSRGGIIRRVKPLIRPIVRALGIKRARLPAGVSGALSQNFSPAYLTGALESSLKRLKTDYIDLYQLHSPADSYIGSDAFGETLQALEKLKAQGKLRFYGIGTETAREAAMCVSVQGISSVQLGFGLLDLQPLDQGTLAAAANRGIAIIARGCYGGGLLKAELSPEQLQGSTPKWHRILALRSASEVMGRQVLDAALQFCRGTAGISVTLLGMRTESHLRHNMSLCSGRALDDGEYRTLREIPD